MMDRYIVVKPEKRRTFEEQVLDVERQVTRIQEDKKSENVYLQWCKVFLSDAQNQYELLVASDLYQKMLANQPFTIVEQAPADGSKLALLLKISDERTACSFLSMRLTDEDTKAMGAYQQTLMLFERYVKWLDGQGLRLDTHCVRTWIYVRDIDNNYAGVVRARNEIFHRYGLTNETHFIASTGIGGASHVRSALVAIDFLTYPKIDEGDKKYLEAQDHLNPTHEYGVAFERGTRLDLNGQYTYYISGTASIDRHGKVVHLRDLDSQTNRLLCNIEALLNDGGATMSDIQYFIVYLRDSSDYEQIDEFMKQLYPQIPFVIVSAKVCRPEWLIEMECVARVTTAPQSLLA